MTSLIPDLCPRLSPRSRCHVYFCLRTADVGDKNLRAQSFPAEIADTVGCSERSVFAITSNLRSFGSP